MALNITDGKRTRPLRIVIYGPEGIGKTTLASRLPRPLFIDTERGTDHLNVRRLELPRSWPDLLAVIPEAARECGTLVIDTADWAEAMCIAYICKKHNQPSIEAFGYGKGYVYVMEEWQKLLKALDGCGVTVVLTAHAKMRKFEQPDEIGAYDRWEMKLTKQVAPLVKEWCDCLLFLNYKTTVVTDSNGHAKAQGGARWVYASHNPCWDAKNRIGLPDAAELDADALAEKISGCVEDVPKPDPVQTEEKKPFPLWDLMQRDGITVDEIEILCDDKHFVPPGTRFDDYSENVRAFLVNGWQNVLKLVEKYREQDLPF